MEPSYARKKLEVIAMLKNASLRGLHLKKIPMSIVADIWKQPVLKSNPTCLLVIVLPLQTLLGKVGSSN